MTQITQISYGLKLNIAKEDSAYRYESEEESEDILIKQFAERHDEFIAQRIAKENQQVFTYTFDNSRIRYERNQCCAPEEFMHILPESGIMQHFYMDEKTRVAKLREHHLYCNTETSDWKITYDIQPHESERKMLLGYDCFRLDVKQTRINEKEGWTIIEQYQLFVTDKINLPASLVIHLWQPVVKFCALEIRSIRTDYPNSYSVQSAVEIKTNLTEEAIALPLRYQDLIKDMD